MNGSNPAGGVKVASGPLWTGVVSEIAARSIGPYMGIKLVVGKRGTAVRMRRGLPLDGAHELRGVDMGDDEFGFVNVEAISNANHLVAIRAVRKPLEVERGGANDAMLGRAPPFI